MTEAERRLDELVRRFVADHLPSFLGLLCDQGVEPGEQRERADRLVKSLRNAEIRAGLEKEGRRIIVDIDREQDPPGVVFNEQFVEEVDASEALSLLEGPIETLLDLTPFRVNLLLQIDDADHRNSLVNRARRSGEEDLARIAEIPSVLELRMHAFVDRVRRVVDMHAEEPELEVDVEDAVQSLLEMNVSGWPSWDQVDLASVEAVVDQLEEAYAGVPSHPTPEATAEICWESVELSPRSALRQAAELLRAERSETLDLGSTLRDLAEVLRDTSEKLPEEASDWRGFRDLADQFHHLFRSEQRMLSWSPVRRDTPVLSIFEPPLESLGLDEPESLPWEAPLLCWNVRERRALCDLLEGTESTVQNELDGDGKFELELERFSELQGLVKIEETPDVAIRPAPKAAAPGREGRERLGPALRACYGRLFRNFCGLEPSQQRTLLQSLRSSYDGYFDDAREVWNRRFQGWKSLEPPQALRLLARQIEYVLGPSTMLEPFDAPFDGDVRQVPGFVFVAPFGPEASVAHVTIPLVALRASFSHAPTQIRAVEVHHDERSNCKWLGDRDLSSSDLAGMPAESVLQSIRRDAVRLQIERD